MKCCFAGKKKVVGPAISLSREFGVSYRNLIRWAGDNILQGSLIGCRISSRSLDGMERPVVYSTFEYVKPAKGFQTFQTE